MNKNIAFGIQPTKSKKNTQSLFESIITLIMLKGRKFE